MGTKPRRSSYQTHCWETLVSQAAPEVVKGASREMAAEMQQGHRDHKALAGDGGHLQASRLPGSGVSCPPIGFFLHLSSV